MMILMMTSREERFFFVDGLTLNDLDEWREDESLFLREKEEGRQKNERRREKEG